MCWERFCYFGRRTPAEWKADVEFNHLMTAAKELQRVVGESIGVTEDEWHLGNLERLKLLEKEVRVVLARTREAKAKI